MQCGVQLRGPARIHFVEPLGDRVGLPPAEELRNRRGVQLTSRDPKPAGSGFGVAEKIVGQRDCCFHTFSITQVIPERLRQSQSIERVDYSALETGRKSGGAGACGFVRSSFAPFRGCILSCRVPSADALGYFLSPLRGFATSSGRRAIRCGAGCGTSRAGRCTLAPRVAGRRGIRRVLIAGGWRRMRCPCAKNLSARR